MNIIKYPEFEGDSYLIVLNDFYINNSDLDKLISNSSEYLKVKSKAFENKSKYVDEFIKFKNNRNSLRNYKKGNLLDSSIYTYASEWKNDMDLDNMLNKIKSELDNNSRRLLIRLANSFSDYYTSIYEYKDVSCCTSIHYLKNKVSLTFRASDIKDELYEDIITIYKHFIKPVYSDKSINIEIFCSCAQNIDGLHELNDKFLKIKKVHGSKK